MIVSLPDKQKLLPAVPKLIAKPLVYMPFALQKKLLSRLLQQIFSEALADGDCEFLQGSWLKVAITDLNISWLFGCNEKNEILINKNGLADVTIEGNLNSFILLAARKEDPDTLFFQRQLTIGGDTELGLQVKNLLDNIELDVLPPIINLSIRCGAEYISLFSKSESEYQ
ncbi:SCP2 sterol-binding domain-containing protein [Endozoicomonas sp. SM1973]|uniref:Ubiquinone biosynthesis accessory factor UbiT n=1 Tax=Spartinivicinus marinus TaxID=2994442 RepID=A0A853I7Y9_9GAMM|nr:SCP2 sterol-binding domain-containing protein [Spartinivicinus marinus]MCX4025299.1 SCP2 sterol-binding domain-containing protein [Spartinivicinus marinus]NYZ66021.1 SCP2 sterol-binding domain-containing protein [Spartinivicinus marinus]